MAEFHSPGDRAKQWGRTFTIAALSVAVLAILLQQWRSGAVAVGLLIAAAHAAFVRARYCNIKLQHWSLPVVLWYLAVFAALTCPAVLIVALGITSNLRDSAVAAVVPAVIAVALLMVMVAINTSRR